MDPTTSWPDATAALAFLDEAARRGGPEPHEYPAFDAWLDRCQQLVDAGALTAGQLRHRAAALGLLDPCTLQGRAFHKPRGYAGDFEMIDLLYRGAACRQRRLRRWDRAWQAHGAAQAVRNRKDYFLRLLDRVSDRHPDTDAVAVLDIASGPARDVAEHFGRRPTSRCEFTCLDLDRDAIAYARKVVDATGRGSRVRFVHGNALRFRSEARFHLVWSAGLFDYLPDKLFVRLVARLWDRVLPGGQLVVGNFHPDNPSRPYMELLGDWHLLHRTPEQLLALGAAAGVPESAMSVGSEELGINLFLHARRP